MTKYWAGVQKEKEQIYLKWGEFDFFIRWLELSVENKQKVFKKSFIGIYGIPRGGLPIAVALSHRLQLPILLAPTDQCIIVDDIWDTGRTLEPLLDRYVTLGNAIMLTWFCAKKGDGYVKSTGYDYHKALDASKWLVFPWEETNG